MKKLELEQLANRLIEIAKDLQNLNKPEGFVKGRWYKGTSWKGYAKFKDKENNCIGFNLIDKSLYTNIRMTEFEYWQPVTDFTELTELLKAEVIKRIGNGKPIGVRDLNQGEKWDGNEKCDSIHYRKRDKNVCCEIYDYPSNWFYNTETDTLYNWGRGVAVFYENGVFATVANDMQAKLEEAKLKYPIGTEFNNLIYKEKFKVCKGVTTHKSYPQYIYAIGEDGCASGIIYNIKTDTWAEIIPQDKGAVLIEQAKKMGFKDEVKYTIKNQNGETIYGICGKEIKYIKNWTGGIDAIDGGGGTVIYRSDTGWATIIQEPIIIDGKEVEINKKSCIINGYPFIKRGLLALQSLNPIFPEILKRMEEKNG